MSDRIFAGIWLLLCIGGMFIAWQIHSEYSYEPAGPRPSKAASGRQCPLERGGAPRGHSCIRCGSARRRTSRQYRAKFKKQRDLRGLFEFNLNGKQLDEYVKKQVNDYREKAKAFGLAK